MGFYEFDETLGSRGLFALDGNRLVTGNHSRGFGRTSRNGGNGDSGSLENAHFHRAVEARNEQRLGGGFEFRIHGEWSDAMPKQSDENKEREDEIERNAREDDERLRKVRFRRERVGIGGRRSKLVFAFQSNETADRQVVERIFAPLLVPADNRGPGGNSHAEFLDLHAGFPGG